MRYLNFQNTIRVCAVVAILGIIQSCGSENLGNKDTMQRDGDGDPTRTGNEGLLSNTVSSDNNSNDTIPESSEDGVKVEVTDFGDEEWAQLKQSRQLEEQSALRQQAREELALGPWEVSENNKYQMVYSYGGEGNLWIRLRLDNSDNNVGVNSAKSDEEMQYLTKEEAESMQLSAAWVEMIRTARLLEESLNIQTKQDPELIEEERN